MGIDELLIQDILQDSQLTVEECFNSIKLKLQNCDADCRDEEVFLVLLGFSIHSKLDFVDVIKPILSHVINSSSINLSFFPSNILITLMNDEYTFVKNYIKLSTKTNFHKKRVLDIINFLLNEIIEKKDAYKKFSIVISSSILQLFDYHGDYIFFARLSFLLRNHPFCIPSNYTQLCQIVIGLISKVVEFKPLIQDPIFVKSIEEIVQFVHYIWNQNVAIVELCIKKIVDYVANGGEQRLALGCFLDNFTPESIYRYFKVLNITTVPDEYLHSILSSMIYWLAWPSNKNSHLWVLELIGKLEDEKRFDTLKKFAETDLSKVLILLLQTKTREMSWPIVAHTLKNYPTDYLFVQALNFFTKLIPLWENTASSEDDHKFIEECFLLIHCLLNRFKDTIIPSAGIQEILKKYKTPTQYEMDQFLRHNVWYTNDFRVSLPTSLSQSNIRSIEEDKVGLINLGMTCYLNSVAQALYMIPELRGYLFKSFEKFTTTSPVSLSCAITFGFMQYTSRSAYEPSCLIKSSRPSAFIDGQQEDCSEYLKHILSSMSDEEDAVQKKLKESKLVDEDENKNEDKNNKIRNLFYGKYQTCITCSTCDKQNFHEDIFNMYILYLNEKQTDAAGNQSYQPINDTNSNCLDNRSLKDLLNNNLQAQIIDEDQDYQCSNCEKKTKAVSTFNFTSLPKYMIFNLALFVFKNGAGVKLMEKIDLVTPLKVHDANGTIYTYELATILVHLGVHCVSGHYYCYTRDFQRSDSGDLEDQSWITFDDANVSKIKFGEVMNEIRSRKTVTPYVVFYRLVEQNEILSEPVLEEKKLMDEITNDNLKFIKEYQQNVKEAYGQRETSSSGWNNNHKPPPSCGGGGFGGGPSLVF